MLADEAFELGRLRVRDQLQPVADGGLERPPGEVEVTAVSTAQGIKEMARNQNRSRVAIPAFENRGLRRFILDSNLVRGGAGLIPVRSSVGGGGSGRKGPACPTGTDVRGSPTGRPSGRVQAADERLPPGSGSRPWERVGVDRLRQGGHDLELTVVSGLPEVEGPPVLQGLETDGDHPLGGVEALPSDGFADLGGRSVPASVTASAQNLTPLYAATTESPVTLSAP